MTGPEKLLSLARKVAEQDIDLYSDPEQRQAVADATELAQGVLELEAERDKAQAKYDAFAFRASNTLVAERERADKAEAALAEALELGCRFASWANAPRADRALREAARRLVELRDKLRADTEAAHGHKASDAD